MTRGLGNLLLASLHNGQCSIMRFMSPGLLVPTTDLLCDLEQITSPPWILLSLCEMKDLNKGPAFSRPHSKGTI